jgi:hypothetical protein
MQARPSHLDANALGSSNRYRRRAGLRDLILFARPAKQGAYES